MTTWTIYDKATGVFVSAFSGPADSLLQNTPNGCGSIEGIYNANSQKVDLATGKVVDYKPPQPANTPDKVWSWDKSSNLWIASKTPLAVAMQVRAERDRRLAACDWVITKALERNEPVGHSWILYRQALRDVSKQAGFPLAVVWPVSP